MTASQQARIIGFNASLSKRGVLLKIDGTEIIVCALIEDTSAELDNFTVDENQKMFARIHILASVDAAKGITYDSVLIEQETGKTYIVRGCEPHDIKFSFRCEVRTPESPDEPSDPE